MATAGLEMALNLGDSGGPLQRAHIHEGSQLPGDSTAEFRLDWTHAFGTIRIEVKAGIVYIDGQPVQTSINSLKVPGTTCRSG